MAMIVLLVEHFFTEEGKARFPVWVREIGEVASRFPGFVDIRQMTRLDAPERSFFMLSFAAPEDVRGWIDSAERQELLVRMAPYRLKEQEGTRWLAGDAWSATDKSV
jgi:antibiotic biosynthesis monooxygenase (ABM) superfamily enzyme